MERDVPQRLLECLEAFDKRGGRGMRMDFYRVGGSTQNAEKLLKTMLECRLIVQKKGSEETYLEKTEYGVILQKLLKNRWELGPLFVILGQKRIRVE